MYDPDFNRYQNAQLDGQNKSNSLLSAGNRLAGITNTELKKLNHTSSQILEANRALVGIQSLALNESTKQTSLLEAQLQIAKIADLEKNKQNQIKQAAYSVGDKVKSYATYSGIKKYFLLQVQSNEVLGVGLTADLPNEINDKHYVKEVLDLLNSEISSSKNEVSSVEIDDVEKYFNHQNQLGYAYEIIEDAEARKAQLNTSIIAVLIGAIKELFGKASIFQKITNFIKTFFNFFINQSKNKAELKRLIEQIDGANLKIAESNAYCLGFTQKYNLP